MRCTSLKLLPYLWIFAWGQSALADDSAPTADEESVLADEAYIDPALSDDIIIVYGALPDRVFRRDTKLRITGAELRKRGVSNLAEALDQLPEINVRAAGRGGRQIDIRGARKGSVKILLDGISISDPFYGNIDISAIPVTDIEEIRVSTSPASPIDGPGGPGGVIEILTSDAAGAPDMVRARVRGSSQPAAEISATGRMRLTSNWGVRMSVSAMLGAQDFELRLDDPNTSETSSFFLSEERDQSVASVRIEYKRGDRRFANDIWLQQASFVAPPARDGSSRFLQIEGESQGRLGLAFDDRWKDYRVQASAYYHLLSRQSSSFEDPQLQALAQDEDLGAARMGVRMSGNRRIGDELKLIASATVDNEKADVNGFDGVQTEGQATIAQAATALQYEGTKTQLHASAGLAVPLGIGADPWGEFKIASQYRPASALGIELTLGHKGRTPTLRERLRIDIGNESLGPEKAYFGELKVSLSPLKRVRLSVASYLRRTNGLIRFDPTTRVLANTKELWTRGIESSFDLNLLSALSVGASYIYAEANSEILGADPLDFFPKHRASTWMRLAYKNSGATARLQYWGTQIDKNTDLDPRLLLQATIFTRIADHYLLNLRAENLSGNIYEQRLGVRGPGRVVFASVQAQW